MKVAEWKDYSVIATGNGYKLEDWAGITLLRPDPQVIWQSSVDMDNYKGLVAKYVRSETGGGKWNFKGRMPEQWTVKYKDLKFAALALVGEVGEVCDVIKKAGIYTEQNTDVKAKITHVGEVLGAGSFYVTAKIMYDGIECVVGLMRPNVENLTITGMDMIKNTIAEIVEKNQKYKKFWSKLFK